MVRDTEKSVGTTTTTTSSTVDKKLLVGLSWNCAAELKLLVSSLFLLCSLATLLLFLPPHFSSDLRPCLTTTTTTTSVLLTSPPPLPTTTPPPFQSSVLLPSGILKRSFLPIGSSSYSLILMSSYRTSPSSFSIITLASKPHHLYSHPSYLCLYKSNSTTTTTSGTPILPDWGYGRVYTVVVITCTFPSPIAPNSGGELLLHSTTNAADRLLNTTTSLTTLIEPPNSLNLSIFTSPPKFDYLYCGSSLYGDLSPQRLREWLAYHIRLFGWKSHFVFHDAGGVNPEVFEVLRPWMELGYVTLQDIRDQERFDGYYHNQFLIVNDCLHRYRLDTKWMFFFDVDEFIYVSGKYSLRLVMDSLKEFSQFTIDQMPMSGKLCLSQDYGKTPKKWGFEKLVYRDVKRGIRKDRKYVVQPRNVFATGVHMSQNLRGKTKAERRIKYFHYHGTISQRREPCRNLINVTEITFEGTPYVLDTSMRGVAPFVKRFELNTIGDRLQKTRQ